MRSSIAIILLIALAIPCSADTPPSTGGASVSADQPPAGTEAGATGDYGGTYPPQALAALDRALAAGNMTRADLRFNKDFAHGYECFPVVKEMMDDPLGIGALINGMRSRVKDDLSQMNDTGFETLINDSTGLFTQSFPNPIWPPYPLCMAVTPPWGDKAEALFRRLRKETSRTGLLDDLAAALALTNEDVDKYSEGLGDTAFRDALLPAMTWHDVDGIKGPGEDAPASSGKADLFRKASAIRVSTAYWFSYYCPFNPRFCRTIPLKLFPTQHPVIRDTPYGRICLGTLHDDTYTGDFAVLIDPGGNDTYRRCRIGAACGKRTHATRLGPDGEPTGVSADYSPLGDGRVGYFCDLGGDDLYDCADVDVTVGAAVLGVAAFYDLGHGNDRYYGGNVSLGAAIGGVATFYDDGGSDTYSGKVFTQGAAGFGIAVMCDDATEPAPVIPSDVEKPDPIPYGALDNDSYSAWSEAQGFARTRGVAICTNARGNDTYQAGGVYLDAPLFTDRYESLSQGMAIGERDIDYAGGIALLADYAGNDTYLGDVYDQGVGYWYSAGFLYDGGGNDHYEMTQYGQGSGIHLAVGGLIDAGGSDTYIMNNGLGQGGSHDYAASLFMDMGGDDRYLGNTSCDGSALTNSVALFFDLGGNDLYAAKHDSLNIGRPARGFGSIGTFVDLGGDDEYLGPMQQDAVWLQPEYGMGIDVGDSLGPLVGIAPPEKREGVAANAGGFDKPSAGLKMPDVLSYEGALTQDVFDKLWELAIRWEVGDNRVIVPAARKKLVAFGPAVLPMVGKRMGDIDDGLALRAQVDVVKAFAVPVGQAAVPVQTPVGQTPSSASSPASGTQTGASAPPVPSTATPESSAAVEALLREQLDSGNDQRVKNALAIISELKLAQLGGDVAKLLDSPDPALVRRAVSVLGASGSHAADARLVQMLDPSTDERLLKVVVEAVTNLGIESVAGKEGAWRGIIALLDDERFPVRDTLVHQLAAHLDIYGKELNLTFCTPVFASASPGESPTAWRDVRSEMRVYQTTDTHPDEYMLDALRWYFDNFGMASAAETDLAARDDALALADHWDKLTADDPKLHAAFEGDAPLAKTIAAAKAAPGPKVQRITPRK